MGRRAVHDLPPEPGLHAVEAGHRQGGVGRAGNAEQVVGMTAGFPGQAHGRPLQGVVGHRVPVAIRRRAVQIARAPAEQRHDDAGHVLTLVCGHQQQQARTASGAGVGGQKQLPEVAQAVPGDALAAGHVAMQAVPAVEPRGAHFAHDDAPALGEPDVVARLRFHRGQQVGFAALQVDDYRALRLHGRGRAPPAGPALLRPRRVIADGEAARRQQRSSRSRQTIEIGAARR